MYTHTYKFVNIYGNLEVTQGLKEDERSQNESKENQQLDD